MLGLVLFFFGEFGVSGSDRRDENVIVVLILFEVIAGSTWPLLLARYSYGNSNV